jgi:hypothetical protein
MRTLLRLALVATFTALSVGLTAGNATAVDSECWSDDGDPGGVSCWIQHLGKYTVDDHVEFRANGEVLIVADLTRNGRGVVAYVNGERYPSLGGDTREFNLSFAEGATIHLTSCRTNNGAEFDCLPATAKA